MYSTPEHSFLMIIHRLEIVDFSILNLIFHLKF